jgi:hypothetical protein
MSRCDPDHKNVGLLCLSLDNSPPSFCLIRARLLLAALEGTVFGGVHTVIKTIIDDVVLFSCTFVLVTGIVLVAANFLI